jgi:ribulose kinase
MATLQALATARHIVDSMNAAGHKIERIVDVRRRHQNRTAARERRRHRLRSSWSAEDAVTLGAALLGAVACSAFA